jgi:thioredoxin reductase (NADPH)
LTTAPESISLRHMKYDVLIIGSGPAGLTAAIYAARAGLKTLLFAGAGAGGQLMLTNLVENYPGFANGIEGPELMAQMRAQALRFGVLVFDDDVTSIDFTPDNLKVYVDGKVFAGRSIIVATGASTMWLGLDSESKLRGRGVSSCATCDGFFFRGREVAIIGGGDTAMEEAIHLTKYVSKVTIIHRSEKFRASDIMVKKAKANPKINWITNTEVLEIIGDKAVDGIRLKNKLTQEEAFLPVMGVFIAIGHKPNTSFLEETKEYVFRDKNGYLIATDHTMTNIPGVFIAGDVRDHRYRQAITAAGDGCMAALDAQEYLSGLDS